MKSIDTRMKNIERLLKGGEPVVQSLNKKPAPRIRKIASKESNNDLISKATDLFTADNKPKVIKKKTSKSDLLNAMKKVKEEDFKE